MRDVVKRLVSLSSRVLDGGKLEGVSILMYHRVVGDVSMELDLPFETFRKQMIWLSRVGGVVSYADAVGILGDGRGLDGGLKFSITFDDAFDDFYKLAFPLLRELRLPATLFVPTRFIDEPECLPLSRVSEEAKQRIRPMSWSQLREVASDPLITIGAHTHTHSELVSLSDEEIAGELSYAAKRFQEELGLVPEHFAYPRGVWDERVRDAIAPHYVSACTTGGEIAKRLRSAGSRYAVPRVPIRRSDGMRWFEDRVYGRLGGEERIVRLMKRALGRSVG